MKKPNLKLSALCIAIGSALAISHSAHAALEEVVVTARKTIENTQDVPISITNFSTEDLAKLSVQNISDIQNTTPSMTIKQGFGAASNAIVGIRGQVQTDGVITFDPSVGLYFDDVYLGRAGGALLNMVDIERIEVLKGPQGTLYGRNTTGGALKVISKKADASAGIEGFVKAGAGNYNLQDFSGAINIPLIQDVLAVRLTGAKVKQDGYTTSYLVQRGAVTTPPYNYTIIDSAETDDTNQESYRANVVWNISDVTSLMLSYDQNSTGDYGQLNRNQRYGDVLQLNNPSFRHPGFDFYQGLTDWISLSESEVKGYSAVLEHEFNDSLSTKLVYAHRETESTFSQDSDGGTSPQPRGSVQSLSDLGQEQDSVEWQLIGSALDDTLNWTAGLFWYDETGYDITTLYSASFGLFARYFADDFESKSKSVFGNATYDISDDLHLQVGIRYTQDEKSMLGRNAYLTPAVIFPPPANLPLNTLCLYQVAGIPAGDLNGSGQSCTYPLQNEWENVSGVVGLDYDLTEDVLVYGKVSTGYRAGGFSLRGADAFTLQSFEPEDVLDFEIGIKGDYFDRMLRLNLAYFHTQYDSIQLTTSTTVGGAFPATGVTNPADATYDGAELEIKLAPIDNLVFDLNASYLGRSFEDKPGAENPFNATTNPNGRGGKTEIANSPRWQASTAATYTLPVGYGEWLFRVDYSYRTDQYASGALRQAETFGEVGLWNARIALDLDQYGLNVAVWGKNLTDEEYYDTGFYRAGAPSLGSPASNTNTLHPAMPMTYGVELTKKF